MASLLGVLHLLAALIAGYTLSFWPATALLGLVLASFCRELWQLGRIGQPHRVTIDRQANIDVYTYPYATPAKAESVWRARLHTTWVGRRAIMVVLRAPGRTIRLWLLAAEASDPAQWHRLRVWLRQGDVVGGR